MTTGRAAVVHSKSMVTHVPHGLPKAKDAAGLGSICRRTARRLHSSGLHPPALIHLCRKVFPQPKLRDRSFPVPRGMTATEGAGSSFSSRIVPSSQATVPSPPAAKMRRRLQPVGRRLC